MKKFYYLLFVAAVAFGCSVDSIEKTDDLQSASMKSKNGQDTDLSTSVYEGPGEAAFVKDNSKNHGYIEVSNDCENLYVVIVPAGEDPEDVHLSFFQGDSNPKENGTEGELNSYEGQTSFTFPLTDFDTSQELRIFSKAWGVFAGTESWGKKASYFSYTFEDVVCNVCVGGKGYWWNHGPNGNPGNQNNAWPKEVLADGLYLGNNNYSAVQLGLIYDRNTQGGNGLVSVAHHLITAKLNVANGADPTTVVEAINSADAFIGDLNLLADSRPQSAVGEFKDVLESYNEGNLGPDSCED